MSTAAQGRDRTQRARARRDAFTTRLVATGGIGVMLLIGAIFVYLLSVVLPLFAPATLSPDARLEALAPLDHAPLLLDVEESGEIGFRVDVTGELLLFDARDGTVLDRRALASSAPIRRVHRPDVEATLYALQADDGIVRFLELAFPVSFAGGARERLLRIEDPFDGSAIDLGTRARGDVLDLAVHLEDTTLTLAVLDASGAVHLLRYAEAERGLPLLPPDAAITLPRDTLSPGTPRRVLLGGAQWLHVVHADGRVDAWDVRYADDPRRLASNRVPAADPERTELLLGGTALLVPTSNGVEHWFPVRTGDGAFDLQRIRSFAVPEGVARILPEARRRGFLVLDAAGGLSAHHTTADATVFRAPLGLGTPRAIALSARGDLLLLEDAAGRLHRRRIDNEHPEASLSALVTPVWYEGYDAPSSRWQSSSASSDFEPKFGLGPLVLGTLKAALYGMLFAIPIALFGAVYTAFFMAPRLRAWIKPSIEIMAALPTVILGFLAGLWLAPLVEARLASVLTLLFIAPAACLLTGAVLQFLPRRLHSVAPDGWQALLMVPVLVATTWLAFTLGPLVEAAFFAGDLRAWMRGTHGIDYDQRNAIVVGIAMGVAVIPVVFAIAEDAIHSVPSRLSHGALALGASRWQTLVRVVLPTASPGIFSALMIGFGRAVGETMIVLMASGNTPVLGMDPFSGMRTFAANLAVELPESEVASSHYRILFLSALVLFVFTFLVNTVGEVVRQRLRERYGHL